jgi:hypothetical protein
MSSSLLFLKLPRVLLHFLSLLLDLSACCPAAPADISLRRTTPFTRWQVSLSTVSTPALMNHKVQTRRARPGVGVDVACCVRDWNALSDGPWTNSATPARRFQCLLWWVFGIIVVVAVAPFHMNFFVVDMLYFRFCRLFWRGGPTEVNG